MWARGPSCRNGDNGHSGRGAVAPPSRAASPSRNVFRSGRFAASPAAPATELRPFKRTGPLIAIRSLIADRFPRQSDDPQAIRFSYAGHSFRENRTGRSASLDLRRRRPDLRPAQPFAAPRPHLYFVETSFALARTPAPSDRRPGPPSHSRIRDQWCRAADPGRSALPKPSAHFSGADATAITRRHPDG